MPRAQPQNWCLAGSLLLHSIEEEEDLGVAHFNFFSWSFKAKEQLHIKADPFPVRTAST